MSGQGGAGARPRPKSARGRQTEQAEPRFRAYLAMSLDGYIADAAGGVGWLDPYFSPEVDFMAFIRTIGATVMGRTTWDWAVAQGHSGEMAGRVIVQTHRRPPRQSACNDLIRGGLLGGDGRIRTAE